MLKGKGSFSFSSPEGIIEPLLEAQGDVPGIAPYFIAHFKAYRMVLTVWLAQNDQLETNNTTTNLPNG